MNKPSVRQSLIAALSSVLVALLNPLLQALKTSRRAPYLPIIIKVLAVLDRLLKENFSDLTSKDIYQHIRYAIVALSDGVLSEAEITTIAGEVLQVFNFQIAADSGVVPTKDPAVIKDNVDAAVAAFKAKQIAVLAPVKPAGANSLLGTVAASGSKV